MVVVRRASSPCAMPSRQSLTILSYITAGILVLLTAFHIAQYVYMESYVWQVTTFADFIDPVERSTCEFRDYRSTLQPNSKSMAATQPAVGNKLNIGLVMLYNDQDGTWDNELMSRVLKNREEYARRHGYRMVVANDVLDRTRPAAWSKLKAVNKHLDSFDYLFYIDMDIVIMNMTIPAERFIGLDPSKDIIMTEDWNGPNTGVWLAKRSQFSHWFLEMAWNQSQMVPPTTKDGTRYPFEYEQRAVHYLLHSDVWSKRKLPVYRDYENVRSHFLFLPQCAMNSYILYPYYWSGNRETAHYIPGDFLVHFAGKKGAVKTNLLNHFLRVAEMS